MGQDCLTNRARLSIESNNAKQIHFDSTICGFAKKKGAQGNVVLITLVNFPTVSSFIYFLQAVVFMK